jgi:hypothetical protein
LLNFGGRWKVYQLLIHPVHEKPEKDHLNRNFSSLLVLLRPHSFFSDLCKIGLLKNCVSMTWTSIPPNAIPSPLKAAQNSAPKLLNHPEKILLFLDVVSNMCSAV